MTEVTERTNGSTDIEGLVRRTGPDLLAYFVRRVADREDAADCVAETFVVLWRRRDSVPTDDDAARAWLFGIARKVLSSFLRGRLRRSNLADRLRLELREDAVAPRDTELEEALGRLRRDDAELVRLVAWEGFGVEEAGAVLGLSPAASRKRYSRARASLRALLN